MPTLAQYLADYLAEEFSRGLLPDQVDYFLMQKAIDAYNSVAADQQPFVIRMLP